MLTCAVSALDLFKDPVDVGRWIFVSACRTDHVELLASSS